MIKLIFSINLGTVSHLLHENVLSYLVFVSLLTDGFDHINIYFGMRLLAMGCDCFMYMGVVVGVYIWVAMDELWVHIWVVIDEYCVHIRSIIDEFRWADSVFVGLILSCMLQ